MAWEAGVELKAAGITFGCGVETLSQHDMAFDERATAEATIAALAGKLVLKAPQNSPQKSPENGPGKAAAPDTKAPIPEDGMPFTPAGYDSHKLVARRSSTTGHFDLEVTLRRRLRLALMADGQAE
jgi:hypothetical protein